MAVNSSKISPLLQRNLKKVMFQGYETVDEILAPVFNQNTSDGPYEEWVAVTGIGQVEEKIEGQPVVFKDLEALDPKRVYITTFALGVRATMEAMQDERYGVLARLSKEVGIRHALRREIERARLFNLGFTTVWRTGYDGKALFASDHPIHGTTWAPGTTNISSEPSRTTTTASNVLDTPADLDYLSLTDAITKIRRTVDEQGDYIELTPRGLLVPVELEPIAYELINSRMRPDTANNAVSSIARHGLQIISSPHLLDTDAFFMFADRHDLQWFDRMRLKIDSEDEFTTGDSLTKGVQRFGLGFGDWRGWVGSQGA